MNTAVMNKGEATRRHLIQTGASLFHLQGYNNTGLQQILKTAGVVKGSFYFHFKDKESFALAVLDHYQQGFRDSLPRHLFNKELDPLQRLEAFHRFHTEHMCSMAFKGGCPLGNFSLEMADNSDVMAAKLSEALNGLSRCFQVVIEDGQQQGLFSNELDSRETAAFVVNSWEGAVLRSKTEQNKGALELWFRFTKNMLSVST